MAEADLLFDGPEDAQWTLILAHGAGQAKAAPFMEVIARQVAVRDIRVVRFDFPYMDMAQRTHTRRPPDRMPVLQQSFRNVIAAVAVERSRLVLGGKSMGGRVASLLADEEQAAGLVCLGYPFHPPGKPENLRVEHLEDLRTPALICQGERDPFGRREEVQNYELAASTRLVWLKDGEHSFKTPKQSTRSERENLEAAAAAVADFILHLS